MLECAVPLDEVKTVLVFLTFVNTGYRCRRTVCLLSMALLNDGYDLKSRWIDD